ncbi:MAG: hypothetical protein V1701_02900 [Planctomycetota bacterium]
MPLNESCSQKAVSENIRREIKSGRTPEQAKAIAMSTLAKACKLTPELQRKSREQGWPVRKIIAAGKRRKNPYPLLIATLANPNKFNGKVDKGLQMHYETHGNDAGANAEQKSIRGIPDGEVAVYQGDLLYLEYQNRVVPNSSKGRDVWGHRKGDKAYAKKTNRVKIYRSVSNPKLNYLIGDNKLILKGFYEG